MFVVLPPLVFSWGINLVLQDVVDPIMDEMLAKFVVDSHFKSQPKGANIAGKSLGNSQEDSEEASTTPVDPEVLYLTPFFVVYYLFSLTFI